MNRRDRTELERALKNDVDLHGDDLSLALTVAQMSEVDKAKSRENIRACAAELRATLTKKAAPGDESSTI